MQEFDILEYLFQKNIVMSFQEITKFFGDTWDHETYIKVLKGLVEKGLLKAEPEGWDNIQGKIFGLTEKGKYVTFDLQTARAVMGPFQFIMNFDSLLHYGESYSEDSATEQK
jgi:hypothetical protein